MFTNLEMKQHTSNKFFEVNFEGISNHLKKKFKKITRERYSKLNCFYIKKLKKRIKVLKITLFKKKKFQHLYEN